jgi:hypothetical protein
VALKITKAERTALAAIILAIDTQRDVMNAARQALAARISEVRDELDQLVSEANQATADYNGELEEFTGWRDVVAGRLNEEVGEKSDKWHESDKASEVADWISTLESIEPEEVEELDEIDLPDVSEEIEEGDFVTEVNDLADAPEMA